MRTVKILATVAALSMFCCGCLSRMFSEGMGAATGASGKVVEMGDTPDLTKYQSLRIEGITVAPGVKAPAELPGLLRGDLLAAAGSRGLGSEGEPALGFSGEITHHEASSTVDTAIGPLEEVIVRARLRDTQTGAIIAEANLIGRSKASSSSGAKNLSAGVGDALDKWLMDGGLKAVGK